MLRARTTFKLLFFSGMLSAIACNGAISCGSCGGPLMPIPGGFNPAAQIERGAQIRVTNKGLDFIETSFQDLMGAYIRMECGAATDVPCPANFVTVPGGNPNPSSCDLVDSVCEEQVTMEPGPLVGFEIERSEQSSATICQDDENDPNRRRCFAWLRFEALQLTPHGPDAVDAVITAQIDSTEIPFRALGADCLVRINSNFDGQPLQDLTMTAHLTEWNAPSGVGGRQLDVNVTDVGAMIPSDDVTITRDPMLGDDFFCDILDFGFIKDIIIGQVAGSLGDIVGEQLDEALGMVCVGPDAFTCPAQTTCDQTDGYCKEDATGAIVPTILGVEGRLDFSSLLGGFGGGRPGQGDISFLVGGTSTGDTEGISVGTLGGAEVVTADPTCAMVLPSPRLRPGWMPPPALPPDRLADLDWDGTPETEYMLAAGVSEALLDQYLWTIYTTGLFCTSLSGYDVDALNTGALGLLMPSLNKLTHGDKYAYAIYPARISLFAGAEPQITIGSGKTSTTSSEPELEEPLIDLFLDDLKVSFQALVEDRWVHLMTVTQDVHLGLGAVATPTNELIFVIGDIAMAISDVRVSNSEILAEDPADLERAIPVLLQLALPQLTGALPPIALPSGTELGGFEVKILGVRGVEGPTDSYPNLAIYADLGFDPALVPPLSFAAETSARVRRIDMPAARALAISAAGGPQHPIVEIELGGDAPDGATLEFQARVDNGLWTPFFRPVDGIYRMKRSELQVQGHHRVEIRARVQGEYRTLDPSPVVLDVVMDAEPPRLDARMAARDGGIVVHAFDVVSRDRITIELGVNGMYRSIRPDAEGFVDVAEVIDVDAGISVRASDEQGLVSEVVLREARLVASEAKLDANDGDHTGCRCTTRAGDPWSFALLFIPLGVIALIARVRPKFG